MYDLVQRGSQFIVATHSPILLAYPNASIYELSGRGIGKVDYENTEHVRITRDFLENPSQYLDRLFAG